MPTWEAEVINFPIKKLKEEDDKVLRQYTVKLLIKKAQQLILMYQKRMSQMMRM